MSPAQANRRNPGFLSFLMLCFGLLSFALQSCGDIEVVDKTIHADSTQVDTVPSAPAWEAEEAPPLEAEVLDQLLPCDGFDYPVGPPNARDYYKFRGFLPKDLEHLGEDWNGTGGGNTDFGDYVYAAADGVVFYSDDFRAGWGEVIRMVHNFGTESHPRYVETLYAHVASSWVRRKC